MKKIINKLKSTHFDVAAGPMLLVFGGSALVLLAIAAFFVMLAIKLIKKAKNEYKNDVPADKSEAEINKPSDAHKDTIATKEDNND